jgi:hypothetical protein
MSRELLPLEVPPAHCNLGELNVTAQIRRGQPFRSSSTDIFVAQETHAKVFDSMVPVMCDCTFSFSKMSQKCKRVLMGVMFASKAEIFGQWSVIL